MKTIESMAIFSIAATVILSLFYFFILDILAARQSKASQSGLIAIYGWRKMTGFFLFGIISAIAYMFIFGEDPSVFGLTIKGISKLWPWLLGAIIFFTLLNYFNSRNKEIRAVYPELRLKEWNLARMAFAAGGWVLYLAGYEFLFRGLLLMSCYDAWGLWPAVVINLALYSALHLPKGLKEAVATIPFGALVCYLTIESQSILPAIILHSWQAVTCEISCIYRNPEMKLTFIKK